MTITSSITTNRTKNESDTNTEKKQVTCNRKPRTYSRTQRIKVTTVGKTNNSSKKNLSQEKQRNGNCSKCKESEISMKMLGEHVGRLEQLVSDLAKTAKSDDRSSTYSKQNLGNLFDVSTCSLEDLQKLMITTTSIMYPQKSSKIVDKSTKIVDKSSKIVDKSSKIVDKSSKIVDKSNNEPNEQVIPISVLKSDSPTFHAEPMEDVSYISNNKLPISKFANAFRQDSGFSESKAGIDFTN
ncbi:hypothetical protein F8M41_015673 [Gigaspora margarita]|uniref:Uncharacterized protein n=1 Tax=Gigaspora margarita TaxID=4874 RepID=A0A8H4EN67_GIGMA|nr:hypothetical protein F8M41_015673 [Gigaspora margarita]